MEHNVCIYISAWGRDGVEVTADQIEEFRNALRDGVNQVLSDFSLEGPDVGVDKCFKETHLQFEDM